MAGLLIILNVHAARIVFFVEQPSLNVVVALGAHWKKGAPCRAAQGAGAAASVSRWV